MLVICITLVEWGMYTGALSPEKGWRDGTKGGSDGTKLIFTSDS